MRRRHHQPAGNGVRAAHAARLDAERKLAETRRQTPEVERMAARVRALSAVDFAAAVEAAMRRRT